MGIELHRGQTIAGFPALILRDLLRSLVGATFRPGYLIDRGFDPKDAPGLIDSLIQSGFIEPDFEARRHDDARDLYKLTKQGEALSRASGAKPVLRKTADRILAQFMDRVQIVDGNPEFLVRVTEVVVFGSYLTGNSNLGDLDIACNYELKFSELDRKSYASVVHEHFKKSGRSSRGLQDLSWPWEQVQLFLKNRKRTISLHPIHDAEEFIRQSDDFRFEVLLGNRESIIERCKSENLPPTSTSTRHRQGTTFSVPLPSLPENPSALPKAGAKSAGRSD
jgi:hypothetical protein